MSTKLSFKELFARQAGASAEDRGSFDTREEALDHRFGLEATRIEQPVSVAKALRSLGLSLRKAHDAIGKLAEARPVVVRLTASPATVAETLAPLGVVATVLEIPDPRVKEIRESLGCSQSEFADRFGLELTTLQNWEQGRNQLDAPARILLAVIERFPAMVDVVLSAPGSALK